MKQSKTKCINTAPRFAGRVDADVRGTKGLAAQFGSAIHTHSPHRWPIGFESASHTGRQQVMVSYGGKPVTAWHWESFAGVSWTRLRISSRIVDS
jgi:hypothetical protein